MEDSLLCPRCGHTGVGEAGKTLSGKHRYFCPVCQNQFVEGWQVERELPDLNRINLLRGRNRLPVKAVLRSVPKPPTWSFPSFKVQFRFPRQIGFKVPTLFWSTWLSSEVAEFILVVLCVSLPYFWVAGGQNTGFKAHVWIAQAWLQGQITPTANSGAWGETLDTPAGLVYPYGPGPAFLLLPWVAIWGDQVNQSWVCAAIGAINAGVMWLLVGRMGESRIWQIFFTALFALGSPHFLYSTFSGNVWPFMHVVVNLGLLIALWDIFGAQRGWVAGLGFGLAFMSRQTVFLSLPFVVLMFWRQAVSWRSLKPFFVSFAGCWGFLFFYNYLRFGNPLQSGYKEVIQQITPPEYLPYGVVSVKYAVKNIQTYFWTLPERLDRFPWFQPTTSGLSMWKAFPALLLLPWGKWGKPMVWCSLAAIVAIMSFYFCYYWDGYTQFGMRYTLDWYPFAFVILVSARQRIHPIIWSVILVSGILIEIWAIIMLRLQHVTV